MSREIELTEADAAFAPLRRAVSGETLHCRGKAVAAPHREPLDVSVVGHRVGHGVDFGECGTLCSVIDSDNAVLGRVVGPLGL